MPKIPRPRPLRFLNRRASSQTSPKSDFSISGSGAEAQQEWFTLPTIPGALPRHRFVLPDEPATVETEDLGTGEQPRWSKSARVPGGKARHITNPIYFGFMVTVGVGFALLCYYLMINVGALAGWLTGAVFIGLGLDPMVRKLEKLGIPRGFGVATVFLAFTAFLSAIIFWVIPVIARQAITFINGFPQQFESFLNSEFFEGLDSRYNIRTAVDAEVDKLFADITADSSVMSSFFNSLINAGSTLAEFLTGTIIVLFLSGYVLASLPTIKAWGVRLAPASKRERVTYLTDKITSSVGQYVSGQAVVAVCNASFALVVMLLVGVPFPQLLMLFVLILAFIPLVGGVSAAALVSLVALLESWQTALFFLIPYLVYLQIEAYFISPRIMSKAVAVPGGVAVIAVAAGAALWGVLGAIIAIPVAASLLILLREVLIPRQDTL